MQPNAYDMVRADLPALGQWSDKEIEATIDALKSTPIELLVYSPIGPFLLLSGISIFRDGMELGAAGRLPPCKDYVTVCAQFADVPFPLAFPTMS